MLYVGYFIIVNGQKTKKNRNFSLERVEKCLSSLCAHQMPLNHRQIANLKFFWGAMAGATQAYQPIRGSPWVLKCIVTE